MMSAVDTSRSGTVVLHIRSGAASPLALEAAARIARSMRAEFESVFVEDDELLSLAELPFAREVSPTGRRTRTLSANELLREMRSRSLTVRREIERVARLADIHCRFTAVRESPNASLTHASERARILVLGEALGDDTHARVPHLTRCFGNVEACLLHGSRARRSTGPVVIALDDLTALRSMTDVISYWTEGRGEEVILVAFGSKTTNRSALIHDLAALLPSETTVRLHVVSDEQPERAIADIAHRAGAGLVVARQMGPLATDDTKLARVVSALDCPLLLLRCVGVTDRRVP